MKKSLKIFGLIITSLLLIIIALVITASLSQNKIVDFTLKKISESTRVPIEIDDVSFTLIKRFPHATIELSGVRVGNENAGNLSTQNLSKDDVLNIKKVYVSVKTIPLIRGEYEVNIIELNDARIHYNVDSLGNSNIDFLLKSDTDVAESDSGGLPLVDLKKVKLRNSFVYYSDDSLKVAANMFFSELDFKGKIEDEKFDGTVEGDVQLTNCSFQNTSLNRMKEATLRFELDYESDTLKIGKLEAKTDGVNIDILGKTAFSENIFTDLHVELKEVELEKLQKYIPDELLKEYGIEEFTGNMNLSGTVQGFVSDSIMPAIDFTFDLKNGFVKTKDYPTLQKINFEGKTSNGSEHNNKTTSANFKTFHAETDSSMVDLTFSIRNFEKPIYDIQSKLKINIEEFRDFIPDSIVQNISGRFIADISTKGQIPDSIDDNFINLLVKNTSANVDFSNIQIEMDSLHVNNLSGSFIYTPNHLIIKDFNTEIPELNLQLKNATADAGFTGKVTQLSELEITLNSLKAETPQGDFWGSAKIKNLEYPEFVADASAKINLAELKPFLPDSLVKNLSGNLDAEVSSFGKLNLDSIAEQISDILFKQSSIKLVATNISVAMPDTLQEISGLNGNAEMQNGKITISKMNGIAAGIDFRVDSTTISNVYEAVIKNRNETVRAQGNFEFGAIDYSILASFFTSEAEEENTSDSTPLNFLFEMKGKISAKSFKYEKALLQDISAKFNLTDSVYIIDQFKANAFDGSTNSSLRYSLTKSNRQIINVKTHFENMDIHKLLYAFDDFGYDSLISYKNVSGIFSSELNGRFVFEADTLVSNDMRVLGNFKLKNGKLINYEPAMEVSKFTGIKELDNIDMKTLECNIFMFKNKIYIPITNIVSSSLDLSTFGMQSMADDYEYHIQLRLGDILKGKSQKLFERQSSSGDEVSEDDLDKNTIKLIYGYVDGKKKVGFATKKAQRQMALKIQVQQKMLELIFHPNLVSFETGVK
jgi:uncharacterized protein involved in outer membrane biogenesis